MQLLNAIGNPMRINGQISYLIQSMGIHWDFEASVVNAGVVDMRGGGANILQADPCSSLAMRFE